MENILTILLIALGIIVGIFILAVVITVLYESGRKKKGKMRREKAIWEDTKRNFFGMPWSFTKYTLDNERFYLDRGMLNTRYDEVRLYRVTDVVLTRSLGQKLFGMGTLHITSSDKTLKNFDIINIKKSASVKELFSQKVEEQRKANRVYTRESISDGDDMDHDDHDGPDDDLHGDD